jgi:hypothetical protein
VTQKYCLEKWSKDTWGSCYVCCDSPRCGKKQYLGGQRGGDYNERDADWYIRCHASSAGWTCDTTWIGMDYQERWAGWANATQDFCPDCSQRKDTLAGKPTRLNGSLEEVKKAIAQWPVWFREHAALEGLLFRDLPAATDPDPVRLYDFSDLVETDG